MQPAKLSELLVIVLITLILLGQISMDLSTKPKRHRYPIEIINSGVWSYHRFNDSYRDVAERLAFRGIQVSHETIRKWCNKFSNTFSDFIKKQQREPTDKWHLDEMNITVNGEYFILRHAVDSEGLELNIFVQKRRNKKAAIRFLRGLLGNYPDPRVLISDKLSSYTRPVNNMIANTEHRSHNDLNNRVENAHQNRREERRTLW
ncbi:IS6 family transposase [Fastidiosibacter lacustris]|uniref:IS6 family transposase n=1 Tax=Fastidiosibacter lacustris TaxID=2056695 RepID=UPI000E34A024|nr:IS6 family transposase [Fastidiosibacter lacustris]